MGRAVRRLVVQVLVTVACVLPWGPAGALELGIRIGGELGGRQAFDSRELFVASRIPVGGGTAARWEMEPVVEAHLGRLRSHGDTLRHAGVSLGLRLRHPGGVLVIGAGIGPTWMSDTVLGTRDYGGPWQFTSHLVVQLRLSDALRFGYRIQHTSNAGLSSPNPGVDIQSFELRLLF